MSQYNPRRYEPKQALNLAGLPLIMAAMLAASVGVGWLFSLIGREVYLIVLFPVLMGIALVFVGVLFGHWAKMRSQGFAVMVGCASALLTVVALHYFDYRHVLDSAGLTASEVSFGAFLNAAAEEGVSIGIRHARAGINLGYIGTWIYWVLEFVAIAFMATKGLQAGAAEPFCARCDAWKDERELGRLRKRGCNIAGYVRQGDVGELKTHVSRKSGNLILSAAVCPHCETESTIVVKLVEITKNKRGQDEHVELTRVVYPGKALDEFEALFKGRRRADEDEREEAESDDEIIEILDDEPETAKAREKETAGIAERKPPDAGRIACPGCSGVLKLARVPPVGKKLQCPRCKTIFVPTRNGVDSEEGIAPAAARLAREKRSPARKRTAGLEHDEGDDDHDDDRPRGSNRNMRLVWAVCGGTAAAVIFLVVAAVFLRPRGKTEDQQVPAADKQVVVHNPVKPLITVEEARRKVKIKRSPDKPALLIPQPVAPGPESKRTTVPGGDATKRTGLEKRPAIPSQPPPSLPDTEAAAALAELRSANALRRSVAAGKIAGAGVNPAWRVEIAKALEPLLADAEVLARMHAAKALKTWGTRDNGPALLKAIDDANGLVHIWIIEALGAIKYEPAAQALVERWSRPGDLFVITKSLQEIGPGVEKFVTPHLQGSDRQLRVQACKVLEAVGTRGCIPALESAKKDRDVLLSRAADVALKAVSERLSVQPR